MNPIASQFYSSAVSSHIKRHMYDLLKDRWPQNEEFVELLISCVRTSKDVDGLGRFVADLYELGYLKCLKDHDAELKRLGIRAEVKPEQFKDEEEVKRIFPHS